jgi:hypothetical protein
LWYYEFKNRTFRRIVGNGRPMRVYLDNCCFNRPFDDQRHLRIRLETEAKLTIQEAVWSGAIQLAWSYILDFENMNNPFEERRKAVRGWKAYATVDCVETTCIKATAGAFAQTGLLEFIKKELPG